MRNSTGILMFSFALVACSGDDSASATDSTTSATTTTAGTSTSASTATTDESSSTGTSAGTSTTGTSDATHVTHTTADTSTSSTTGGVDQTCASYCSIYLPACADFSEYDNEAACLAQCSQWPVGSADDVSGDTLGCRIYHATVADTVDANLHCPHAGPSGGAFKGDPVCVDPAAPTCANYCTVYFGNCKDANNVYADQAECEATCADWYQGSLADTTGDTVGCRTYHAGAALGDPALHCPHASPSGGGVCII